MTADPSAPPSYDDVKLSAIHKQPGTPIVSTVGGLVTADFIPVCLKSGGVFSWAEFERFPVVIQRANQWLSQNPGLEVRTCETVEYSTQSNGSLVNTEWSVFTVSGEGATRYVRGLRLWLQPALPHEAGSSSAAQIGYFNILPQIQANLFNIEASERLDTLLLKTNALLQTRPLQGKILTIETVTLKCDSNGVDPDATAWTERGLGNPHYVYMLRIYYQPGPPAYETVGIADFVPGMLSDGGLFGRPQLESFPTVLSKAYAWMLVQSPQINLLNIQTLFFKQRWSTMMDTMIMTYSEANLHSYYVRYLRLAYVVTNPAYNGGQPLRNPGGSVRLNCKLFVPGMIEPPGCCNMGTYESQLDVRKRMDDWMRATGAKVVSAETIPMRIFSGAEAIEGFDTMHTWNRVDVQTHHNPHSTLHNNGLHHNHHHHNHGGLHGHQRYHGRGATYTTTHKAPENYLVMYRVYLDGTYPEPPGQPELPSVEEYMMQQSKACIIL